MKKSFRLIILLTIVIMLVACLVACNEEEGGGIVVVPSKVVVTFDTNGGSEVPAITIDENTALTLPTPPTKEGYTFAGWYVDKETTTAFQNTNTIPSNVTVYAKWTENVPDEPEVVKYAVTFVGGASATGTAPTMESQYAGAEITLPENTFSAVNHTFAGWYDGSTIRQPGAVYTMTASAVTFTATWTANAKYAVTFVGGEGATGTAPTMESQYAGAEITLPANTFTKAHHTFAGWLLGSDTYQPEAEYTMTASAVTFTATWTENAKYAVTFVGGEGATGTAPVIEDKYEGEIVPLPANTFTKGHHTFVGWTDGEENYTVDAEYPMPAEDVTFTVVWYEDAKSGFDFIGGDDATGTAPTMIYQYVGDEITLPANTFAKENNAFDGWLDGNGNIYQSGESYTVGAQSLTFTAAWNPTNTDVKYTLSSTGTSYVAAARNTAITTADIAPSLNGLPVTTIPVEGFKDCSALTSVTIPSSVTTMGENAFMNCEALASVSFGQNIQLQSIGKSTFGDCVNLLGIAIPASVTVIEANAFQNCEALASVSFDADNRLQSIREEAFVRCAALDTLDFGVLSKLTSIGARAFGWCKFDTLDLGENNLLENIGEAAFYCCIASTSITLPNSLTSIGAGAFADNVGLISITLPFVGAEAKTMYDADQYPFGYIFGEISLLGITGTTQHYFPSEFSLTDDIMYFIPNTLRTVVITGSTHIPNGAFSNCAALTAITLPDSVTSVGVSAFDGCTSLSTINVSSTNNVTIVGYDAFTNTAWLDAQADDLVYFGNFAYVYQGDPSATSVELRANTTGIGSMAFADFTGLTEITIPDSVKHIGAEAFSGCTALDSVIIGEDSRLELMGDSPFEFDLAEASFNGLLYLGKVAYQYYGDVSALSSISLRNDTTVLATGVFRDCSALTSIAIPDTVKYIGNGAFVGCSKLATVTFGENSQLEVIGPYAFTTCMSLTSITIPSSVKLIENEAFSVTPALSGVYITDLAAWCGIVFANETSNPLCSAYTLYVNGVKATDITIPDSVKLIRDYAFFNCDSLVSVTFADSVTSVGVEAFYDCTKLMTVSFSENSKLKSLGVNSFGNCVNMMEITLPPLLVDIEDRAFGSSYKLVHITNLSNCLNTAIGASIYEALDQEIRTNTETAFVNALTVDSDGVVTYTVGATVYCMGYIGDETALDLSDKRITVIYEDAFALNKMLTSVILPSTLKSIDYGAFYGTHSLTSIIIPESTEIIGEYAFENSGIIEITILSSSLTIRDGAFESCSRLVHITNLSGQPLTGLSLNPEQEIRTSTETAFDNTLSTDSDGIITYTVDTTVYCMGSEVIETAVDLSDKGITAIYNYAFAYNETLTEVTIPSSVTEIGSSSFGDCYKLSKINFDGTQAQWNAILKDSAWDSSIFSYTVHCSDAIFTVNLV